MSDSSGRVSATPQVQDINTCRKGGVNLEKVISAGGAVSERALAGKGCRGCKMCEVLCAERSSKHPNLSPSAAHRPQGAGCC